MRAFAACALPCLDVPCPLPRWTRPGARVGCFPRPCCLPRPPRGSASTTALRGLLRLHTRCGPSMRSTAQGGPAGPASPARGHALSQGANPAGCPAKPPAGDRASRPLPGTIARVGSHPQAERVLRGAPEDHGGPPRFGRAAARRRRGRAASPPREAAHPLCGRPRRGTRHESRGERQNAVRDRGPAVAPRPERPRAGTACRLNTPLWACRCFWCAERRAVPPVRAGRAGCTETKPAHATQYGMLVGPGPLHPPVAGMQRRAGCVVYGIFPFRNRLALPAASMFLIRSCPPRH